MSITSSDCGLVFALSALFCEDTIRSDNVVQAR